ncbi:MAG TPA: DNA methylase [Thermoplasmatales archaeon]|nr:DNA methylase [Thermoplasmatales archaeon]
MVTSPGHKLGQMIGNFLEEMFGKDLVSFSEKYRFYCDRKGERPEVRGRRRKVTWEDNRGNSHDMDFVIERNGTFEQKGEPVAFIELAWRRYTKHSRNKAGEIEGALLPLKETYQETCSFIGVIIAGEFTEGGISQLISNGIQVLHIPFNVIVECFKTKDIDLDYPEDASDDLKRELIQCWESLSDEDIEEIEQCIKRRTETNYQRFMNALEQSLLRRIETIRLVPLFGEEKNFSKVEDAIRLIEEYPETNSNNYTFKGYEIYVRFTNGDKLEGRFQNKNMALKFLRALI